MQSNEHDFDSPVEISKLQINCWNSPITTNKNPTVGKFSKRPGTTLFFEESTIIDDNDFDKQIQNNTDYLIQLPYPNLDSPTMSYQNPKVENRFDLKDRQISKNLELSEYLEESTIIGGRDFDSPINIDLNKNINLDSPTIIYQIKDGQMGNAFKTPQPVPKHAGKAKSILDTTFVASPSIRGRIKYNTHDEIVMTPQKSQHNAEVVEDYSGPASLLRTIMINHQEISSITLEVDDKNDLQNLVEKSVLFCDKNPKFRNYKFKQVLGEGGSSKVYKVFDSGRQSDYALKVISYSDFVTKEMVETELKILSVMSNTGRSIKLIDSGISHIGAFIVMELAMIDLKTFFTEKENDIDPFSIHLYWYDMLKCVQAMHDKRIAHLDLKLQNFVLTANGEVKLIDYGISRLLPNDISIIDDNSGCGTVVYMSPEMLSSTKIYPKKCDVWAMGVILYVIIYNIQPKFTLNEKIRDAKSIEEYTNYVINWDFYMPDNHRNAARTLLNWVQLCLQKDAIQRPYVDDIIKKMHIL